MVATPFVLTNARLFAGGADLTGMNNKLELPAEVEDKDVTTYGSGGYKEVLGALKMADLTAEGFWEAGDPSKVDDNQWALQGTVDAWSAGPNGAAVGDLVYLTKALQASYQLGGTVGDVAPWSAKAKTSWPIARGRIAHPPGTPRTSTGTGTAQQLGAVASGRSLYAALHVLSVSGTATPTITVQIESDNGAGFGSPATALSLTAATAVGGQIARAAGPITDDWFRPKWTISGTTPSFLFVVAFGIA